MKATGSRSLLAALAMVAVAVLWLPAHAQGQDGQAAVTAAVPAQAELADLQSVADATGVSVVLASQSGLHGKTFALDNPPRVVIDFRGVVNRVSRRVHPVNAGGVRRVRVAQFATAPEPIVRVVVDLDEAMPATFESRPDGGLLRIGEAQATAAEALPAAEPDVVEAHASIPGAGADAAPGGDVKPASATVESATVAAEPVASVAVAPEAVSTALAAAPPVEIAAAQTVTPAPAREAAPVPVSPVSIVNDPPARMAAKTATGQNSPASQAPMAKARSLVEPPAVATSEPGGMTSSSAAAGEQAAPDAAHTLTSAHEVESQERRFTGEPISLELKDADIKDVLRTFAKITGLNVVVDPDVSGSVTVNLENVPWDQCLYIILKINKLDYVVENNVLRIARISALTSEKAALAALQKAEDSSKPMRTVTKTLSYAKAADVKAVLTAQSFILSERGSVVIDPRTNQLIIRDAADRIDGILNLIDTLDQPTPQVVIEARIVETTRTFSRALGVNWGFSASGDIQHGTNTPYKFPNSYNASSQIDYSVPGVKVVGLAFADILDAFNLDFVLSAAESDGLAKVVSSPKVTTQNNIKAHIQSGVQLPIQTVSNNTTTVQYIDATMSLDVTPQITAEGTVMLDIDIKKREPLKGINIQQANNVPISTRDAKTTVMVRDGGTTVIGGIYQFSEDDSKNGVPGLNKLPVIGALFRNRTQANKHDELLIFITPRIVKY